MYVRAVFINISLSMCMCHPPIHIPAHTHTRPPIHTSVQDKHIENPYEINLMEELTLRGITQVRRPPP